MKFSLLTLALLATSVVAAPASPAFKVEANPGGSRTGYAPSSLETRLAQRAAGLRKTGPLEIAESLIERAVPDAVGTPTIATHTASGWSGMVIETPPAGTFTAVSATFTVPKPTHVSNGYSGTQSSCAWVGIDGYGSNVILQTGIDMTVTSSGAVTYTPWYEWWPAWQGDFSGMSISPGHSLFLQVVSSSPTSGTAIIKNLSTGQQVTQPLNSSQPLLGQNAEWIVEDQIFSNHSYVPLDDWNSITFTNSFAQTSTNQIVNAYQGGTVFVMQQNGVTYSSTSGSGSTVTVQYIGPN